MVWNSYDQAYIGHSIILEFRNNKCLLFGLTIRYEFQAVVNMHPVMRWIHFSKDGWKTLRNPRTLVLPLPLMIAAPKIRGIDPY